MIVELRVTYDPETGRAQVAGPLENRPLCWQLVGLVIETLVLQAQGTHQHRRSPLVGLPPGVTP